MWRWLRKIYLFPLMLLLGNEGEAATETGGAVPATPAAEPGAATDAAPVTTTDAGASEPASSPAAEQEGESGVVDPTSQEGATPTGGKQPHQKSLDERVAELVGKKEVEIEQRLMAKLQETTQAQKLDFIPDLDMNKVNQFIVDKQAEIDKALLEGRGMDAMGLQDELNGTISKIRANEARKAEYMRGREQEQLSEQKTAELNEGIENASKLVATEYKIPEEVWKKAEDWFRAERQAKPLVDAQYRERVLIHGPVNALLWAKEYVERNMGKEQEAQKQAIETAKESLPAGKTAGGTMTDATTTKLNALREAAKSGNPSDLAAYSEYKRSLPTN